jgi:hypothetical protein
MCSVKNLCGISHNFASGRNIPSLTLYVDSNVTDRGPRTGTTHWDHTFVSIHKEKIAKLLLIAEVPNEVLDKGVTVIKIT